MWDTSFMFHFQCPENTCFQMMKKMYEDGDDEMKRTIAKAWTEGQEKKGSNSF